MANLGHITILSEENFATPCLGNSPKSAPALAEQRHSKSLALKSVRVRLSPRAPTENRYPSASLYRWFLSRIAPTFAIILLLSPAAHAQDAGGAFRFMNSSGCAYGGGFGGGWWAVVFVVGVIAVRTRWRAR